MSFSAAYEYCLTFISRGSRVLPGLAPHTSSPVSYAEEAKLEQRNRRHVLKSSSNYLQYEDLLGVLGCRLHLSGDQT